MKNRLLFGANISLALLVIFSASEAVGQFGRLNRGNACRSIPQSTCITQPECGQFWVRGSRIRQFRPQPLRFGATSCFNPCQPAPIGCNVLYSSPTGLANSNVAIPPFQSGFYVPNSPVISSPVISSPFVAPAPLIAQPPQPGCNCGALANRESIGQQNGKMPTEANKSTETRFIVCPGRYLGNIGAYHAYEKMDCPSGKPLSGVLIYKFQIIPGCDSNGGCNTNVIPVFDGDDLARKIPNLFDSNGEFNRDVLDQLNEEHKKTGKIEMLESIISQPSNSATSKAASNRPGPAN